MSTTPVGQAGEGGWQLAGRSVALMASAPPATSPEVMPPASTRSNLVQPGTTEQVAASGMVPASGALFGDDPQAASARNDGTKATTLRLFDVIGADYAPPGIGWHTHALFTHPECAFGLALPVAPSTVPSW